MDSSTSYIPSESIVNDIRPPPYAPSHRNMACQECQRRQAKLSEQLRDVTIMNDKWQKYNEERECYIKSLRKDLGCLTKKMLDLERRLKETTGELDQTRARETHSKMLLKEHQTTIGNFGKLMDDLDEKTLREQTLSMKVAELETEVQSLQRYRGRRDDGTERVELLQQQLEVCIDDFRTEKREKERYKDEADTLRQKSQETENLLQDYQEKVALIQSLRFPTIPPSVTSSNKRSSGKRRSSVQTRRKSPASPKPSKPSSWSYTSDHLHFPSLIEADCIEELGSQSDSAMYEREYVEGIPAKPLNQLFKRTQGPEVENQNDLGSDSVFLHDETELIRH